METKLKITDHKWLRDGKTIYTLHKTGRYINGFPELCNEFYFGIQPDYARNVTDEHAEEIAEQIHDALTVANETGLTPRELLERYREAVEMLEGLVFMIDNRKLILDDMFVNAKNNASQIIQKSKQQ